MLDPDEPREGAPTIDPASTVHGITIDKSYIVNLPVPGRVFESVIGAAAGEQGEGAFSFSGPSGLDNTYYVDDSLDELKPIANDDGVTFSRGTTLVVDLETLEVE